MKSCIVLLKGLRYYKGNFRTVFDSNYVMYQAMNHQVIILDKRQLIHNEFGWAYSYKNSRAYFLNDKFVSSNTEGNNIIISNKYWRKYLKLLAFI